MLNTIIMGQKTNSSLPTTIPAYYLLFIVHDMVVTLVALGPVRDSPVYQS